MYIWLQGLCAGLIGATFLESFSWLISPMWFLVTLSFYSKTRLMGGLITGILLLVVQVQPLIDAQFAECVTAEPFNLTVEVVSNPTTKLGVVKFNGKIVRVEKPHCALKIPSMMRVTWLSSEALSPGMTVVGVFKLRQSRSFRNPGGFDFERWMFASHLAGSAYVISARTVTNGSPTALASLRQNLSTRLAALDLKHPGVQWALASGDTSWLEEQDWALFRDTGTIHLMIVSGFHVSLVAAIGVFIFRLVFGLTPGLYLFITRRRLSLLGGGVSACGYVFFVGATSSSLRALVQVMAVLFFLYLGRRIDPFRGFVLALSVVLVMTPLAPLQAGFWFSFLAVLALIICLGTGSTNGHKLRLFINAQLVVLIALAPLLLMFNGSVALVAPLANMVLIPVVSVLVVPLSLFGIAMLPIFSSLAEIVLNFNDLVVEFCYWYMDSLSNSPVVYLPPFKSLLVLAITLMAAYGVLIAWSWWLRSGSVLLYVVALWPTFAEIPFGEFRLYVLDVGQGLAILIDTNKHRLIFDTGPRYRSGFDLGEAVVVPSFRATGQSHLDTLVISHGDIDHAGGLRFVQETLNPQRLLVGSEVTKSPKQTACRRDMRWQWDGVVFQMLHPGNRPTNRNNGSCVLLISSAKAKALLTGDIDRLAELSLVYQGLDKVEMLVVPHHGSRSSSSRRFLETTRPVWSVVSVGHDNRFGHPHDEVVFRLEEQDAKIVLTHECGAVLWKSWQSQNIGCQRTGYRPFWRH